MPPDSDEAGHEETESLWAELGLPEPPFLDESRAPPVDRDLILRLVRRELPEAQDEALTRLIVLFKSWGDAHAEIVREEMYRRRKEG